MARTLRPECLAGVCPFIGRRSNDQTPFRKITRHVRIGVLKHHKLHLSHVRTRTTRFYTIHARITIADSLVPKTNRVLGIWQHWHIIQPQSLRSICITSKRGHARKCHSGDVTIAIISSCPNTIGVHAAIFRKPQILLYIGAIGWLWLPVR